MAFKKGLWKRIKPSQIYDKIDLVRATKSDISTINNWIREQGLKPVNPDDEDILFEGVTVIKFFKAWEQRRKIPLKPGQCLCVGCGEPFYPKVKPAKLMGSGRFNEDGSETKVELNKCPNCGHIAGHFRSGRKEVKSEMGI